MELEKIKWISTDNYLPGSNNIPILALVRKDIKLKPKLVASRHISSIKFYHSADVEFFSLLNFAPNLNFSLEGSVIKKVWVWHGEAKSLNSAAQEDMESQSIDVNSLDKYLVGKMSSDFISTYFDTDDDSSRWFSSHHIQYWSPVYM